MAFQIFPTQKITLETDELFDFQNDKWQQKIKYKNQIKNA